MSSIYDCVSESFSSIWYVDTLSLYLNELESKSFVLRGIFIVFNILCPKILDGWWDIQNLICWSYPHDWFTYHYAVFQGPRFWLRKAEKTKPKKEKTNNCIICRTCSWGKRCPPVSRYWWDENTSTYQRQHNYSKRNMKYFVSSVAWNCNNEHYFIIILVTPPHNCGGVIFLLQFVCVCVCE